MPPLLWLQAPTVALQGEVVSATAVVIAGTEALPTARLAVRALHRDSQQLLAVQPGADQPLQQADKGEGWLLGELAPGQSRAVQFTLLVAHRGSVDLRAALQYASVALGSGSRPEGGKAVVGVVLPVEKPLKLDLKMLGPPRTHTLLAAASATPPPSAATSAQTEAAEAATAVGVQGLSLQDSSAVSLSAAADTSSAGSAAIVSPAQAAAGAGAMPPADSSDMAALIARDLPSRFVLPAGQVCMAVAVLHSTCSTPIDIVDLQLQPVAVGSSEAGPAGGGLELLVLGAAGAPGPEQPATLGKGDVLTTLFSLRSAAPAEAPSAGRLAIRWRRHGTVAEQARAVRGLAAVEDTPAGQASTSIGAAASGSEMMQVVTTTVSLPAVSFRPALLTATTTWPPAGAEAGQPLPLQLHLSNSSSSAGLDVSVALGEPRGFLLAGDQSYVVALLDFVSKASCFPWPQPTHLLPLPLWLLQVPRWTLTTCCRRAARASAGRRCRTTLASSSCRRSPLAPQPWARPQKSLWAASCLSSTQPWLRPVLHSCKAGV